MVSLDVAASEAIRIAKRQIRENQGRVQAFRKPGDILWELVNGNMKWRLRYDSRPEDEKQKLIAAGGSRFCAGTHFGVVETPKSGRHLNYGGPNDFLTAQAANMSEVDADWEYTTECIKLKKIFIVGALVDMIEGMFPSSTENAYKILQFKRNASSDRE